MWWIFWEDTGDNAKCKMKNAKCKSKRQVAMNHFIMNKCKTASQ